MLYSLSIPLAVHILYLTDYRLANILRGNDFQFCAKIKTQNKLDDIPLFYMTGGFRFEKLNFLYRAMLKALKKVVAKKADRTSQEDFMAQYLGTSFDNSEKSQIMPLVEYCR